VSCSKPALEQEQGLRLVTSGSKHKQGKEEKMKLLLSRRKEIIQISVEINGMQTIKQLMKIRS
jgi:hypothetical protein